MSDWGGSLKELPTTNGSIERSEIIDLLSDLIDKNLVVYDKSAGRYHLLESIRNYGRSCLNDQDESASWRSRHLDFFLVFAEVAKPNLTGADAKKWLDRLEMDHDNFRSALDWSMDERGSPKVGMRLAAALWRFWDMHGYLSEGRYQLSRALAHVEAIELSAERARALTGAGNLAYRQADYEAARSLQEESLALRQELGDKKGIAIALGNLGIIANQQGDSDLSRIYQEKSLAIRKEIGDDLGIALSLGNLGVLARAKGDWELSRTLEEESLAIRRKFGDKWGIALSLNNLGESAYNEGDYVVARALYVESLVIRQELEEKLGIAESLGGFAQLCSAQSYGLKAALLWGAAEALRERIGYPMPAIQRGEYDRVVSAARANVGIENFATAWREGRSMTMEEAIECALDNSA
jgi:tetratricopeptide (TPR) repeat protein